MIEDTFLHLPYHPLEDGKNQLDHLWKASISLEVSYVAPLANVAQWKWKQKIVNNDNNNNNNNKQIINIDNKHNIHKNYDDDDDDDCKDEENNGLQK